MAINLGNVHRLTYDVRDAAQALTNPATVTLTITPEVTGVAETPTVTLPPAVTGELFYDHLCVQPGLHRVRWVTTGPTTAEDYLFTVERATAAIISVDEVVDHLRPEQGELSSDADREHLQWLCLVASSVVAGEVDKVLTRSTVTDTFDGGQHVLRLRSGPVVSITSITESGVAVDSTGYYLDSFGLLHRGSTTYSQAWGWGWQNVAVTYVAGLAAVNTEKADRDFRICRKVALNLVQGMWQNAQQAAPQFEDAREGLSFAVGALTQGELAAYQALRDPVFA